MNALNFPRCRRRATLQLTDCSPPNALAPVAALHRSSLLCILASPLQPQPSLPYALHSFRVENTMRTGRSSSVPPVTKVARNTSRSTSVPPDAHAPNSHVSEDSSECPCLTLLLFIDSCM